MAKRGRDTEKKYDNAVDLSDETARVSRPVSRRDAFFGRVVITVFLVLAVAATAFFAYLTYRITLSGVSDRESIGLMGGDVSPVSESEGSKVSGDDADGMSEATTGQSSVTASAGDIGVAVLNGGAPKGSAASVAQTLIKAGFSKAEVGNAEGDYTGTVVYHAAGKGPEAESVKKALPAAYAAASVRDADPQRPETARATVVVVLGR